MPADPHWHSVALGWEREAREAKTQMLMYRDALVDLVKWQANDCDEDPTAFFDRAKEVLRHFGEWDG